MLSWAIFITIVVVVTGILNKVVRFGALACLLSSVISTLLFQLLAMIQLGHVDKFVLIAVAITFPLALIISALEIFLLRKFDPVLKEDAKE
jgi:hypothetical protein